MLETYQLGAARGALGNTIDLARATRDSGVGRGKRRFRARRRPQKGPRLRGDRHLALLRNSRHVLTIHLMNREQSPWNRVPTTFSDAIRALRYQIADLLANIEAENHGLDARTATLALLDTAYGAALTFCATPDRARHHVGDAIDSIHAGALARGARKTAAEAVSSATRRDAWTRPAAPPSGRPFLAVTVAVLSWLTIAFLAHRGPVSPWNLLGPVFCTALAVMSAYRFVVSGGYIRPGLALSRVVSACEPFSRSPQQTRPPPESPSSTSTTPSQGTH